MIKIFFAGRLCADPELRTTTNGTSVCNLRLAARTSAKDAEGNYVTDFYNATAWSGLADNCAKFLKKGSVVYIAGEPRKREYTAKDGSKRTDTEIHIENLEFGPNMSASSASSPSSPAPAARREAPASIPGADEDLPF